MGPLETDPDENQGNAGRGQESTAGGTAIEAPQHIKLFKHEQGAGGESAGADRDHAAKKIIRSGGWPTGMPPPSSEGPASHEHADRDAERATHIEERYRKVDVHIS